MSMIKHPHWSLIFIMMFFLLAVSSCLTLTALENGKQSTARNNPDAVFKDLIGRPLVVMSGKVG